MRKAVTLPGPAVVDTNSRTGAPGCTLTWSAYPSMACSAPGWVSCQAAGTAGREGAAVGVGDEVADACPVGAFPVQPVSTLAATPTATASATTDGTAQRLRTYDS